MNRRPARESGGLAVVQAAIITCFLVLLGRCAWIALVNGPDYAVRAVQQRSVDVLARYIAASASCLDGRLILTAVAIF